MRKNRSGVEVPSGDIYGDAGLIQYTQGGHTWLEVENGVHLSEKGDGGFPMGTSAFMVLPGSNRNAVKCYVDIWVFTRVNENLDAQMKIVPGNVIMDNCRGLFYPNVYAGSSMSDESYPSIFVTYPHDFRLVVARGEAQVKFTQPDETTVIHGYTHIEDSPSNPSLAVNVLKKQNGTTFANYGDSTYAPNGKRYHWAIGLGRSAGNEGVESRYSGGQLSSAWKSSAGWFTVGNLEKDFDWSEDDENFDGWIYFCGTAYYPGSPITAGVTAVPNRVTIPGLKRLLDYYPWAIRKSSTWMSCNRSGGHLKSREGSTWSDRKNRQ